MTTFIWQNTFPLTTHADLSELAQATSLTAALSDLGAVFSVQLHQLGETQSWWAFDDFRLPETMFSRRVSLCLNDVAVVEAMSLCEPTSRWREILHCGTTPLGAILFSGSLNISRSPIQFAILNHNLLARRSWFDWEGERLYLVECFLPQIANFRKKHTRHHTNSV